MRHVSVGMHDFRIEQYETRYRTSQLKTASRIGTLVGALSLALAAAAFAQSMGGVYTATSQSIAGGGGYSEGGDFALDATAGQNDAGGTLSGGIYEVVGGFQPVANGDAVFSNGFE